MPACSTPSAWRARQSSSCVKMTRPWFRARARWSRSVAPDSPSSAVIVTSMPRRRSPSAKAVGQCSSRWKRIVRGIALPSLIEDGWRAVAKIGRGFAAFLDVPLDLVAVVPIVGEGGVNVGQRQTGVLGNDLVGTEPHPLVPDDDVLHLDSVSLDPRFPAADTGRDFHMFGNHRA